MIQKEIEQFIERHAGINQRLTEIYTKLGYLESRFAKAQANATERLEKLKYCDKVLFKIARQCMSIKPKSPESTLKTIYEMAMNAHRDLNNND